jgi:hypothetical protein
LTFFAIFFSQSRWNWWIEWRIDIFCNWDNVIEQIGFWLCCLKSDQWFSSKDDKISNSKDEVYYIFFTVWGIYPSINENKLYR